jgi:phosphoglycerate dehydrogenase-like enzyme
MTRQTVLVIADPKADYLNPLRKFSEEVDLIIANQLEALLAAAPQAHAMLFVDDPNLLRTVLPHAKQLIWVHSFSAGVEKVLFPEMVTSPVVLTNARGVYSRPLAEFVIAGVLYFAKDIPRLVRNQQMGVWEEFDVEEAHGKVMGIVGYGETGKACAERARALGMRVLATRRRPHLSHNDPRVEAVWGAERIPEMLPKCDYVVLATPATTGTRKLIGEAEINLMNPHAVLINIGRGSTVDEAALVAALQQGRIRGAALDVFEKEPLPEGHPFYQMKNVLLSPHSADHTPDWRDRALKCFIENLKRFLAGQPLENIVDKEGGY